MAFLFEISEVGLVASVLQVVVGGAMSDLGQFEPILLLVERALEFILVDGLEGLAVVERGVLCDFDRLDELGVDLLVEEFTVVLLE